MNRKSMRQAMSGRVVFIGCQFCGKTDKPLRNYFTGKICPRCLRKKQEIDAVRYAEGIKQKGAVPNSGTRKEQQ